MPRHVIDRTKRLSMIVLGGLIVGAVVGPPTVAVAKDLVQEVFITNTSANPLPVAGTVNVGNLPATQQVTGTVSVANGIDHAPAEPFDATAFISAGIGGFPVASDVLFVVPEGKTAVIETVSAWFQADPGLVPRLTISESIIGVGSSAHFVALHQEGVAAAPSRPDFERWMFNGAQTLRLYAPSGSQVRAEVFLPLMIQGDPTVSCIGRVEVTGYLVDAEVTAGP